MYSIRFLEELRVARVRTNEKRLEIVKAAQELFELHGFDRTSMAMISERVGGSKATLYGYFRSKEEILSAVLVYDVTEEADRLMNEILAAGNLRDGLVQLGFAYMMRRLSATPVANIRMVATLPNGSAIGKDFYEKVLRPAWQRLADRFEIMMDAGILQRTDPWIAAMHWKGLNEWDMFECRLLQAIPGPDPEVLKVSAALAADAFLKLYATDAEKAKKAKPSATKAAKPKRKAA